MQQLFMWGASRLTALRALAACAILAALCACGVPVTPATPTAVVLTVTVSPGVLPTLVISATPAPSVTVQPTPDVPIGSFHPLPRAVGTINVLQAVCSSRATTWNLYDWGMVASFDEVGERACLSGGLL